MTLPDLSIFAEVSVALLGFSGLASALSTVSDENRAFITIRLKALLFISGTACFGSLAPLTGLPLYHSSILLAVLTAATIYKIAREFLQTENVAPSPLLVFFSVGWGVLAVSYQVFALVTAPDSLTVAYMFTLGGTVTIAIVFFIRFVFAMVQDSQ